MPIVTTIPTNISTSGRMKKYLWIKCTSIKVENNNKWFVYISNGDVLLSNRYSIVVQIWSQGAGIAQSVWQLDCGLYNRIIVIHAWGRNYLFPTMSRPALGSILPPVQCVLEFPSLGVKRQGRDINHWFPSSAEGFMTYFSRGTIVSTCTFPCQVAFFL
jgi:hypothetical protein